MSSNSRKDRNIDEYTEYYNTPYVFRPLSMRKVRSVAELNRLKAKLDALEAKLGVCVPALERLACLGNGIYYGNSDGNRIAQTALALLENKL